MNQFALITTGRCPPREQLAQFLDGRLAAAVRDAVARHIASCDQCRLALDAVESCCEWPLVDLSSQGFAPSFLNERGLAELEENAQRIRVNDNNPPLVSCLLRDNLDPAIPEQIGQYRILEKLGQGGMGAVYRALHVNLKREVALKLLPAHLTASPGHLARFYREMEAIGRIESPHVVRASDAGHADGWHFLVMEYVPGVDVQRLVKANGPLAIADACEIIRQAALGLAAIDKHGLVHRDIKPSNLLLTKVGQVKILDLGLARLLTAESDGELTGSEHTLGTAAYMAPEQIGGSRHADIRADIYSLGCTFYTLLTKQPPFSGEKYESPQAKMVAHLHDEPPAIQSLCPDVPDELATVIARMMAKSPADRLGTPTDVIDGVTPFAAVNAIRELDLASVDVYHVGALLDTHSDWSRATTRSLPVNRSAWNRTRWPILRVTVTVIALALLAALGAAMLQHLRNLDSAAVEKEAEEKDEMPPPPPQVRASQWEQRLAYKPVELCWPKDGTSIWNWDEVGQRLAMQSGDRGMLQLGSTQQPSYALRFALNQTPWVGGLDIFFGYHPADYEGKPAWKCQVISIVNLQDHPVTPTFELRRGHVYHVPLQNVKVERIFPSSHFAGHPVPTLYEEQVLEIEIRYHALHNVKLNGVTLTNLLTGNERYEEDDYIGGFGISTARSAVVVSDASYKIVRNPR